MNVAGDQLAADSAGAEDGANARWKITTGGDLSLPKIGDVRVKWSRTLPSAPPTVTVVKDAAGRYFASFVVETGQDETLPATSGQAGIDLGLTHFAILSDGTKIDSPRFLRRAEKKLKREQQRLSRKAKGSNNRTKARIKVARAHAQVADARREFHHQLSTKLIRENQAVAVEDWRSRDSPARAWPGGRTGPAGLPGLQRVHHNAIIANRCDDHSMRFDPYADIAAIRHPMPQSGQADPPDCLDDARQDTLERRIDDAGNLEAASDGVETDPLILAIQEARVRRQAADTEIRRLIAYGRKFVPRPYQLHVLAAASGMTTSGIRTAYTHDTVADVAREVGRQPTGR
jgi:hypothetical protein